MHKPQLLFSVLLLLATSCGKSRGDAAPPAAEKIVEAGTSNSDWSLKEYRSSPSDRIEAMYAELLKNDEELKSLEKKIADLQKAKNDSLAVWEDYQSLIDQYYANAAQRTDTLASTFDQYQIHDKDLSSRLKTIVTASKARQEARTREFRDITALMDQNEVNIQDRHKALKVMLTLEVIEAYQLENMPSLDGLKAVSKAQKATQTDLDAKLKEAGL